MQKRKQEWKTRQKVSAGRGIRMSHVTADEVVEVAEVSVTVEIVVSAKSEKFYQIDF